MPSRRKGRDASRVDGCDGEFRRPRRRESAQSWKELLVDLKARGLTLAPEVAVGDGALGFWKALDEAFSSPRRQRRRVHKTANVLDKLPKALQSNVHHDLRGVIFRDGVEVEIQAQSAA